MKFLKLFLLIYIGILFVSTETVISSTDPLDSLTFEPSLPYTTASHQSIIYNNKIYVFGGSGQGDVDHDEILMANINPDNSLSNWEFLSTKLPKKLLWHNVINYGNRIYLLGGAESKPRITISNIYTAFINLDGTISEWTSLTPLPKNLAVGGVIIHNNKIYYMGGITLNPSQTFEAEIYYAEIQPDGAIGNWQTAGLLPEPKAAFANFIINNRLLIIGGTTNNTFATSSVLSTLLDANGKISTWQSLSSLPRTLHRPIFVTANNNLFLMGGVDNSHSFFNSILYSTLDSEGLPSSWLISNLNLPNHNCCVPAVENNGHIYITGGHNGSSYFSSVLNLKMKSSPSPSPSPTPTPTPTPTSVPTTKVVMIPGLGASWNADALLNCKNEGYSGDWTLASYAEGTYNPFLNALGEKAKPFYYDWRRDVRSQATPLKNFINSLLIEGEKIHLVGHSLGGLVGRAYLENQTINSKLDKLLTVGSPHQGSPLAYPAWSAGEIWQNNFVHRLAITILQRRCGGLFGNNRETIRQHVPSLQNLLPIFDYLRAKTTGLLKPVNGMDAQNNWLPTGFSPPFFGVTVGALSGNGFATIKYIQVKERNRRDERLGNWVDGKPVDREYTNEGDGTALLSSSQLTGAENLVINQNHDGLITSDEGIDKILDFLGIDALSSLTTDYVELKSALLLMGHPANFWVEQNGKIIKDKNGLVSLINPPSRGYKFGLLPKSGQTLFIVAQFLEDGRVFWKEYNFQNRLPKLGTINFNHSRPLEDPLKFFP